MHDSVKTFFLKHVVADEFRGKRVLEVGSYDVNGGLRDLVKPLGPTEYIGTDMREGPGVDLVIAAAHLENIFGQARFDAIVCTEMLEHAEDWKGAVRAMKAVLAPGGVIYLTTRSPGFPLHDHPGDFWRFDLYNIHAAFCDFDIAALMDDPEAPGVFLKAIRPGADYEPIPFEDVEVMRIS